MTDLDKYIAFNLKYPLPKASTAKTSCSNHIAYMMKYIYIDEKHRIVGLHFIFKFRKHADLSASNP